MSVKQFDKLQTYTYHNTVDIRTGGNMNKNELAWMAGFWDGEGSIGLIKDKKTRILVCQLSSTCIKSIKKILSILKNQNISGRGYTYQERDPLKHRDAHYLRVTGISNILKFSKLMVDYSVTKKRHWEIAIEWANRRIKVAGGVDNKGHLFRGGSGKDRDYSDEDLVLANELTELNRRGPKSRPNYCEGRIK